VNVAWLFPGQGTQAVGMGKAVHDASPAAREVFARADEALGWSISKLCFEGPEADLTLTRNTQPAIVTTSIAILAALREALPALPAPQFAAGHSLGEYSALVATGALSLEDAVRIAHLRGKSMQEAVPEGHGAMAAIMGADAALIDELCNEARADQVVQPANYNAPGQIVIAGHAEAVARASRLAAERKLKAIVLKVSAPFHCALMAPAARVVEQSLKSIQIGELAFPVVSNVDAEPNRDATRVADLLVRQIDSPVRWDRSMTRMGDAGVTRALEIGPGKVLAGLVKRIDKRIEVLSVSDPDGIAKAASFLGA
jgi:[acyl-carrier-protein] S-malonyltransferase